MAGDGERAPASSAQQRRTLPTRGSAARDRSMDWKGHSECSASVGGIGSLQMVTPEQIPRSLDCRTGSHSSGCSASDSQAASFDICPSGSKNSVKLSRSLLELNRERKREELTRDVAAVQNLRPGMVLLKNFLKPSDQIKIIKDCRQLGVGIGGFYTPGYREGAKLNLHMMCLGKNWDPDSSSYEDRRSFDAALPPKLPEEFRKFVKGAIEAAHEFLKQKGVPDVDEELPPMSPDICVVNFYSKSGKLGLHQDKDETRDSLRKGLPVVSFSLGDTAEFLYGDLRDEDRASRLDLESGDVLLFGGKSRHIFHGVSSIKPKTAPKWLIDGTNLRPGRINLTFRQY